jgi:hypothetical protein
MKSDDKKKGIVGVSGEYFVAAELSQLGVVATLTLKNTPAIDLIATNLDRGKTANIQVKTMSVCNRAGWRLGKKDEEPSQIKNHYYVFVDLQGPGKLPDYIIIPQLTFAPFLKRRHKKWLSKPKRNGEPRKDTPIRVFDPNRDVECRKFAEPYRNNWQILDLW